MILLLAIAFSIPYVLNLSSSWNVPLNFFLGDLILLAIPLLVLKRKRLEFNSNDKKIFLIIGLLFFQNFVSVILKIPSNNQGPIYGLFSALRTDSFILFFFVGYFLINDYRKITLLKLLYLFFSICLGIFVFENAYQILTGQMHFATRWGANIFGYDAFGYPNYFGIFLLLYFWLGVLLANLYKNYKKYIILINFLILIYMLFLFSRSAYIGFFASLAFYLLIYPRTQKGYLLAFATVLIGGVLLWGVNTYSSQSISSRLDYTFQNGHLDDSTWSRLQFKKIASEYMLKNPILGSGFSPFSDISSTAYGLNPNTSLSDSYRYSTPHDQYLMVGYKSGVTGLAIFLLILLMILRRFMKNKAISTTNRKIYIPLLAGFVGIMISNFSQDNLNFIFIAGLFFLISGMFFKQQNYDILLNRRYSI